jgi:hypothetical protein
MRGNVNVKSGPILQQPGPEIPLTSVWWRDQEFVELCLYSLISLHGECRDNFISAAPALFHFRFTLWNLTLMTLVKSIIFKILIT